jgi:hypothetical protein
LVGSRSCASLAVAAFTRHSPGEIGPAHATPIAVHGRSPSGTRDFTAGTRDLTAGTRDFIAATRDFTG